MKGRCGTCDRLLNVSPGPLAFSKDGTERYRLYVPDIHGWYSHVGCPRPDRHLEGIDEWIRHPFTTALSCEFCGPVKPEEITISNGNCFGSRKPI